MQADTEYLRNTLVKAEDLCEDDEVRRLAREDRKVCALVRIIRDLAAVTERVADTLVRERTDEIVRVTEDRVASYYEQCRAEDEIRFSYLASRYRVLENVNSFAHYRLGESHRAITGLQWEIKKQENLVKLRDVGIDFKDQTIAHQKRMLEEWEHWGKEHGWTPRELGYQPLPDEATATATPDNIASQATAGADTNNTGREDIESEHGDRIAEDLPNRRDVAGIYVAGISFQQLANSALTYDRIRNTVDDAFYGTQRVVGPNPRDESVRSDDEDNVPALTDDSSNTTTTSDVTLVTERDVADDDVAAWSWVDNHARAYWEE